LGDRYGCDLKPTHFDGKYFRYIDDDKMMVMITLNSVGSYHNLFRFVSWTDREWRR